MTEHIPLHTILHWTDPLTGAMTEQLQLKGGKLTAEHDVLHGA